MEKILEEKIKFLKTELGRKLYPTNSMIALVEPLNEPTPGYIIERYYIVKRRGRGVTLKEVKGGVK